MWKVIVKWLLVANWFGILDTNKILDTCSRGKTPLPVRVRFGLKLGLELGPIVLEPVLNLFNFKNIAELWQWQSHPFCILHILMDPLPPKCKEIECPLIFLYWPQNLLLAEVNIKQFPIKIIALPKQKTATCIRFFEIQVSL